MTSDNILDGISGTYGSHYGIDDLYSETESVLRVAVASGNPYLAAWGAKKEIHYAEVTFDGKTTTVECCACSDELYDAVDTLVWVAAGRNDFAGSGYEALGKLLNTKDDNKIQAAYDEIVEQLADSYEEYHYASTSTDKLVTFEEVMEAVCHCTDLAEENSKKAWDEAVDYVKDCIFPEDPNDYVGMGWVGKDGRP
jgi:hypothetical protein